METIRMVYAGQRRDGDDVVGLWFKLRDGQPDLTYRTRFTKKGRGTKLSGKGGIWVGDVYEFETDGTTYRMLSDRSVDRLGTRELVQTWKAEEASDLASREADKRAAEKDHIGESTLDELRELYRKQIGSARRAGLIAAVIRHVTG